MFNKLFNAIFNHKKEVSVELAENVSLTLIPVCGGVNAIIVENTGIFTRTERAFFANVDELINSLQLTDNVIIGKLSKAF